MYYTGNEVNKGQNIIEVNMLHHFLKSAATASIYEVDDVGHVRCWTRAMAPLYGNRPLIIFIGNNGADF